MTEDIVNRLRSHVTSRGGAKIKNGAWDMMLEAADEIERLRTELQELEQKREEVYDDYYDYMQAVEHNMRS